MTIIIIILYLDIVKQLFLCAMTTWHYKDVHYHSLTYGCMGFLSAYVLHVSNALYRVNDTFHKQLTNLQYVYSNSMSLFALDTNTIRYHFTDFDRSLDVHLGSVSH